MRKIYFTGILLIFVAGCTTTYHYPTTKSDYTTEFKLRYFEACLAKGFDNKEIQILNGIDKSGMSDRILDLNDYSFIDSIAFSSTRDVGKFSSIAGGEIAEGAEGKHVYSVCLDNYQSKWLNNLAIERFKKAKRGAIDFYRFGN